MKSAIPSTIITNTAEGWNRTQIIELDKKTENGPVERKAPGRKPSKGRFESRDELVQFVWRRWLQSDSSLNDIAIAARVNRSAISKILEAKEGYPLAADQKTNATP